MDSAVNLTLSSYYSLLWVNYLGVTLVEHTVIEELKAARRHGLKTRDLSTQRSPRAQSLRTFQSTLGVSDASAFSAHSAVKLEDIVISLENSTVPARSLVTEKEAQLLNHLKQGY